MYLLLNREEAVTGMANQILARHLKKIQPPWDKTNQYLDKIKHQQSKSGLIEIDFSVVNGLLKEDVQSYKDQVVTEYKKKYRPTIRWLAEKFDNINLDHQQLIEDYINREPDSFVKNVGLQLTDTPIWAISGDYIPDDQNVIIRNVLNNDELLQHRMQNNLPFWFIDSGYTNFMTGKKTWHRLVKNHIHHTPQMGYFPADRLSLLPSLPMPWRQDGDSILVIENSKYHYQMFGTTLEEWRENMRVQLQKYSERAVVFRPKDLNRKTRDNLYEHLQNSNYYCVVTDASCSAIEAVWAGIPIITLNQHISTPVARTSLADIDNLYRGPIGDWLCALSYSQFTKKEMYDGTALKLINKYHV